MTQAVQDEAPFKDYCLILQVHPEADAGMIEAAYWHLARRYNEESGSDPLAKQRLEELNEAYSVMGNPVRREEYSRLRDEALGEGTLPKAELPPREAPPLAVMQKQAPRSRGASPSTTATSRSRFSLNLNLKFDPRLENFVRPSWHNTLLVLLGLSLTAVLSAVSADRALVVAAFGASIIASASPLLWQLTMANIASASQQGPSAESDVSTRLRDLSSKNFR